MKNNAPVYQETYYTDVPITARITPILATIERSNVSPVTFGIVGGVLVGAGLFLFGYRIGYLAGILAPWYDARGWIALLFIAIGLPVLTIWYSNQR